MAEPIYADEHLVLHAGDCAEVMAALDADSIDAIVTDPPYGIGFMGHEWDQPGEYAATSADHGYGGFAFRGESHPAMEAGRYDLSATAQRRYQAWCEAWAIEALRVAKPGAYLLAFGGTRTVHRLASAIEDAGWEIRDCLVWAYASGFPKSRNVGKDIDRMAGAVRPVVGTIEAPGYADANVEQGAQGRSTTSFDVLDAEPVTPEAARWRGWGTALKPAWEPIVMARKPLRGTVAANVLAYGTGALNIDATRIPMAPEDAAAIDGMGGFGKAGARSHAIYGSFAGDAQAAAHAAGRWPANVLLTDPIFDGDVPGVVGGGEAGGGFGTAGGVVEHAAFDGGMRNRGNAIGYGDSGTYSRFYLIPKAARSDREPVLGGQLPERRPPGWSSGPQPRENVHPTVKPTELMRHLVRLVTAPGGVVLDPFLGSGTTALAAEAEGLRCVGIDRDPAYVEIARARLRGNQRGLGL